MLYKKWIIPLWVYDEAVKWIFKGLEATSQMMPRRKILIEVVGAGGTCLELKSTQTSTLLPWNAWVLPGLCTCWPLEMWLIPLLLYLQALPVIPGSGGEYNVIAFCSNYWIESIPPTGARHEECNQQHWTLNFCHSSTPPNLTSCKISLNENITFFFLYKVYI